MSETMLRHGNVYLKKNAKGKEYFIITATPEGKQMLGTAGGNVYINMFPDSAKIAAVRASGEYGKTSVGFAFFNQPKGEGATNTYKKPYSKPDAPAQKPASTDTDVPF